MNCDANINCYTYPVLIIHFGVLHEGSDSDAFFLAFSKFHFQILHVDHIILEHCDLICAPMVLLLTPGRHLPL